MRPPVKSMAIRQAACPFPRRGSDFLRPASDDPGPGHPFRDSGSVPELQRGAVSRGRAAIGHPGAPTWYDQNAGRPARQYQWSIGVQRQLMRIWRWRPAMWAIVESGGMRPGLVDVNALTPQRIAAAGLNINNPADVTLLQSPMNSALAISRGFGKPPFAGFPTTLTVAQSLRPFPQFSSITFPVGAGRQYKVQLPPAK